jgi:hypothetical protein
MGDLRDISLRNAEGIARLKAGDTVAARDIWIDALVQLEELFVISTTEDDDYDEDLGNSDDSLEDRYDCDMEDSSNVDDGEEESVISLEFSEKGDEWEDEASSSHDVEVSAGPSTRATSSSVVDAIRSQPGSQQATKLSERVNVEPCVTSKRRRGDSNATPTEQPQTVSTNTYSISFSTADQQHLGSVRPVCVTPGVSAITGSQCQQPKPPLQQQQQVHDPSFTAGGVYIGQSTTSIYNRTWQLPSEGPYELEHLSAAVLFNLALIHHRTALYANNLVDQANSLYEAVRWYRKAYDFLREASLMVTWVLYLRAALVFNLMHIYSTLGDFTTLFSLCQELQQIRMMLSTLSLTSTHGEWTNSSAMVTPSPNPSSSLCWNAPLNDDEPDIEFLQKSMLSLSVMGSAVVSG